MQSNQKLSHNADDIQHPSSNTLLATMREVSQSPALITSTSRTLANHRNTLCPNTRIHQLPPIRLPQIQPQRVSSPEQLIRIPKLRRKLRPNLLPNGIATGPNTRPHCRHQVLNPRPILRPHPRNALLNDPRHRPPPPRMKRRHHPLLHIDHQHRNTIRRPHPHQHPRHIGHQPIPLQHRPALRSLKPTLQRPISLPHHSHNPRMNLPHSHQRKTTIFTTNFQQKPSPILCHQCRIVLLRPPQIQRLPPINRRNSTTSPAKPMSQPPKPLPPPNPYNI
jgi:hypothetical protein